MKTIYGLVIFSEYGRNVLNLPPMTLAQAERARQTLADMGKQVSVINLESF